MKYSLTYTGIILMALVSYFGMTYEEAEAWLKTTSVIIAGLIALYGRWRMGDINLLGWKK